MKRRLFLVFGAMALYLLSGFIVRTAWESVPFQALPMLAGQLAAPAAGQDGVPTLAGVFSEVDETGQGGLEPGRPSPVLSRTPRPRTPRPAPPTAAPPATTPTPMREAALTVYDEMLHPDWIILDGTGVEVNLASRAVVKSGRVAIAMTPEKDFASLFFALQPESGEVYPRRQVTGLKFWLNSGAELLTLDSLAVTVVGSNIHPYWSADDHSVTNTIDPIFSETRLYYLGINRDVPAGTWVEVELWLDEREYDPEYRYVTGFYVKSEEGFRRTVYIDNIRLIMLESE